jgi:hypothetical protein
MRTRFVLLSSLLLLASACGGGSSTSSDSNGTSPSSVNLSGTWNGRWTSVTGVSGATTSTFVQNGSTVTGEFRFTGSPCFAAAKFEGTIVGSDLTGTARAGGIVVTMSGTVTSGSIDGTYSVGQAGACSNDTGTFTSQR